MICSSPMGMESLDNRHVRLMTPNGSCACPAHRLKEETWVKSFCGWHLLVPWGQYHDIYLLASHSDLPVVRSHGGLLP